MSTLHLNSNEPTTDLYQSYHNTSTRKSFDVVLERISTKNIIRIYIWILQWMYGCLVLLFFRFEFQLNVKCAYRIWKRKLVAF